MIDFKPIKLSHKALYEKYLSLGALRGCNFSFANVYFWGKQQIAESNGCMLTFSQFGKYFVYPYPLGCGDKKAAIEAIIEDAKERHIPCRFSGLLKAECEELEAMLPDQFIFKTNRDADDYVYDINDLADLKGKKYHSKRNHLNRFYSAHPSFVVEPLSENNIEAVKAMAKNWFLHREVPEGESFTLEKEALEKAFDDYKGLELETLVLKEYDKILAFTMASRVSEYTFDVHFEKALIDLEGGYTAINCEFAKYIRAKYPEIRYLNREEDMGLEGLRKAKLSYHPHHMIEKISAVKK